MRDGGLLLLFPHRLKTESFTRCAMLWLGYTGRFWETATREAYGLPLLFEPHAHARVYTGVCHSARDALRRPGYTVLRLYYDARPSAAISEKYDQTTKCTHHPMGLP